MDGRRCKGTLESLQEPNSGARRREQDCNRLKLADRVGQFLGSLHFDPSKQNGLPRRFIMPDFV
jgi:hypothetical protein